MMRIQADILHNRHCEGEARSNPASDTFWIASFLAMTVVQNIRLNPPHPCHPRSKKAGLLRSSQGRMRPLLYRSFPYKRYFHIHFDFFAV